MNKNIDTKLPILPIGAVAQALNVHQRTLRIYDEEGILTPKRTEKNRRYYSLDDFEKAKAIVFLTRNLALNLYGVKIFFSLIEDKKIKPENYLDFLKQLAKNANISEQQQQDNIEKASKKGRKKES